ncbi:glycosyltransferase family 9 protein [Phytohabitans sp. ZYX-F-186]|uniref:Glycosyltransferase family 9 protein n=1 Tax=Phytohabitans maris TaxID=3071409 RepID=A0ABU0ZD25_9ACTN|nr:glycosyltransferase family 9 protein [Phytohabitans sp. ZYX-F-186]MDQ7904968.1 glycosyltransferase family 9 protein [Phytohabitans sp. ZYX-F-186]
MEHPAALAGPPIDWAALRRILVVRPDNLGDVVMAGPAVRALRRAAPDARLDLLAAPAGAAVAPLLPHLGAVLAASVSWQQLDPDAVPPDADHGLVRRIAGGRYDAAVVLTSFSQSPWPAAYLCRLAGVPVRVGESKEFGGAGLTHWVPAPPDGTHQVDRMLHVLARVGVPPAGARLRLDLPEGARAEAREALAGQGLAAGEPYALLLPGASCPSRRYPPERFARVAGLLAGAGLRVVVAGSAAESALVERAGGGVTGLGVPGLAALVAGSTAVVCNNSGGAHLASAFGRPVVVLFAGTEQVAQYAPRFTPATVLSVPTPCAPCRQLRCPYAQECLDVPPEEVARETLRLAGVRVSIAW